MTANNYKLKAKQFKLYDARQRLKTNDSQMRLHFVPSRVSVARHKKKRQKKNPAADAIENYLEER